MKQNWENFKKAIKEARRTSRPLYGFDTWRTVRVSIEGVRHRVYDLNPFRVNLKNGHYKFAVMDVVTGEWHHLPNLKKYFMSKKVAEE